VAFCVTLPTLELQEAFTTSLTADAPAWETIASSYAPGVGGLRSFESRQGKSSDLDRDAAGTATFVVDVRDRELDPSNAASSHYPYVTPNRPIRLAVGYVAEVLRDRPRSYWRLGEYTPTSSTWRDEQRSSVGQGINTPTPWATGVLAGDHAASFASASSECIDTGDLSLFEAGDCTYEAWIKTTTSGVNQSIFSEGNSGGTSGLSTLRVSSTGRAEFVCRNDAGTNYSTTGTTVVNDGAWHHLQGRKVGTGITVWVDRAVDGPATTISGKFTQNK
jgi:hypothetical protein